MSEENRDFAESEEMNVSQSKKKKRIVIITTAAIVVIAVVAVCVWKFAGSSETAGGENTSGNTVTAAETTQLTPGIENGEFVESVPAASQSSGSSGNGSGGGSQSGSGSQGGSGSQDQNQSAGGSENGGSDNGDSEKEEPISRYIKVEITMPNDGGASDKLFVYVNGELQNEEGVDVSINGWVYRFRTAEQYEGVVRVEARLRNYGTSASQVSTETGDSVMFSMPLDGSEENFVDLG